MSTPPPHALRRTHGVCHGGMGRPPDFRCAGRSQGGREGRPEGILAAIAAFDADPDGAEAGGGGNEEDQV